MESPHDTFSMGHTMDHPYSGTFSMGHTMDHPYSGTFSMGHTMAHIIYTNEI